MNCELLLEYLPTPSGGCGNALVGQWKMRESLYKADGKEFKRFRLLPHVPHQKFTIGTTYIGRDEQGEFIYCPLTGVAIAHVQIICDEEDGKYRLQAVKGAVVQLNGQDLADDNQVVLQAGDIIRLTSCLEEEERVELEWRNADSSRNSDTSPIASFLFIREHNYVKVSHERSSPLPSSPFQAGIQSSTISGTLPFDYVVLRRIHRFLSLSDLKGCRLVCTTWNSASTPHVLQRTTLRLTLDSSLSKSHFFHFMHRKLPMAHPNLHLSLPSLKDISSSQLKKKCLDDLTWLLSDLQGLRRLRLECYLESEEDHSALVNIFECVGHGLEELDFKAYIRYNDCLPNCFPPSISFPNLAKLCIKMNDNTTFTQDAVPWIQSLSAAMNRITHLEVKEPSKSLLAFLDKTPFPRLTSIRCSKGVNVEILKILQGQSPRLRILELEPNGNPPLQVTMLTMELVRKHAESLVGLALYIPRKAKELLSIDFPIMPNLRTLSITTCPLNSDRGNMPTQLTFLGAPRVHYGTHFPTLEALTVLPEWYSRKRFLMMEPRHSLQTMEDCHGLRSFTYSSNAIQNIQEVWEECSSVLKHFFSVEIGTQHNHLVELNVPYSLSVELTRGHWTTTTSSRIPHLTSMFPNVNNGCLRQSRNH